MNMKTTKFLAVLAILAFAFAAIAVSLNDEVATTDATAADGETYSDQAVKMVVKQSSGDVTVGYATLSAAITGQSSYSSATAFEITLMADVVETHGTQTISKDTKITLNGKTLTTHVTNATSSTYTRTDYGYGVGTGADLEIVGTAAGSKIVADNHSYVFFTSVSSAGDLTVNGGTYVNTNEAGRFFLWEALSSAGSSNAKFTNVTINASVCIWAGNKAAGSMEISGSTLKGDLPVYLGCVNSATVKSCTIDATETAIEIKSGPVTIENCTLSSKNYEPGTGTIRYDGSGSGSTTVNINNGYLGFTSATKTVVEIKSSSLVNTYYPGAPTVIITAGQANQELEFKSDSSVTINDVELAYANLTGNTIGLTLGSEEINMVSGTTTSESITAGEVNVISKSATISEGGISVPANTEIVIPAGATLTGATAKPITLNDSATIKSTGGVLVGKIISGANYIDVADLTGDFTIEKGSVYINGKITSASNIKVSGDVVIEGSATAAITITADAATNLSFGAGFVAEAGLTIDVKTYEVTINHDSTVTGNVVFKGTTGKVILGANFTAIGTITNGNDTPGTNKITINSDDSTKTRTIAATTAIVDANFTKGTGVTFATVSGEGVLLVADGATITADQIATYDIFVLTDALGGTATLSEDLPEGKTIYLRGAELTIGASITVTKAKIIEGGYKTYAGEGGSIKIAASKVLTLDTADIIADIIAEDDATVIVAVAKTQTIDGQTISDVAVGYGNTLTIRNLTFESGNTVKAFGILNIEGTNTIGAGASLYVAASGEAFVTGTLAVAGTAIVEGQMTVAGTVTINGLSNKNASFTVTAEIDPEDEDDFGVLVLAGAKFSLLSPSNTTYNNYLVIPQAVNAFVVFGELSLNGTFTGAITDLGTVKVNGSAYSSTIYIFDEISVTVTSVTGTLAISDAGAAKAEMGSMTSAYYSDGNVIYLNNVKSLTVYDAVNTKVSTLGVKYFWADMYIGGVASGIATGTDGSIRMSASVTSSDSNKTIGPTTATKRYGQIYVPESLALGEKITIDLYRGTIVVDGAVTALAANSGIVAEADSTLKVNGTVSIGLKATGQVITGTGKVNAAYVTVTDATTADKTGIYAALDNIIADIASYDDSKITIIGTVTSSAAFDLKFGETIIVSSGAKLTLKGDVNVADGATINNSGTVAVNNYLYAANYPGSMIGTAAESDVVVSDGNAKTLLSLARAIKEGMKEITLAKGITISSNLTIPDDVIVYNNGKTIKVSDYYTLTIDGSLVMTGDVLPTLGTDSAVVVNGSLLATKAFDAAPYNKLEGAHFTTKISGTAYNVISNITLATVMCGSGTITVYGHLSAGDIILAKDAKAAELKIVIENISGDKLSSLSVSSLTLVGSVLDLQTGNGVFNGTVAALCGDGSDIAEIEFSGAKGVKLTTSAVEKPAGTEYSLLIEGTVAGADASFGRIAIADGTVTLSNDLTATGKNAIGVLAGAVLDVKDKTLTAGVTDDIAAKNVCLVNYGSITVDGGKLVVTGIAVNDGTIFAENNVTDAVFVKGVLYNLGSIIMSEVTGEVAKMKIGDATAGKIIMGEKPEALGADDAYISGYVVYGNNASFIKAYPGSDLSDAKIDWNEGLGVNGVIASDFVINGEVYMTAIVKPSAVTFNTFIAGEDFELIGVVTTGLNTITNWYSDIAMKVGDKLAEGTEITESIPAVYAYAATSTVTGTITEGVGLKIFVDGKNIVGPQALTIGAHKVTYELQAGYESTGVKMLFNGAVVVEGTFVITVDMSDFTLSVMGATPIPEPEPTPTPEEKSEWTVTTILLCVLVVLIAIMAVIVALRLNRN